MSNDPNLIFLQSNTVRGRNTGDKKKTSLTFRREDSNEIYKKNMDSANFLWRKTISYA